jgi:hypothetical protein
MLDNLRSLERLTPDHEKAAHRIGDRNLEHRPPNARRQAAQERTLAVKGADTTMLDITTANDRIDMRLSN